MQIRRICATDGPALREIRLRSINTDNAAFGIHRDQLLALTDAAWTDLCLANAHEASTIVVAVAERHIVGVVGCIHDPSPKRHHCGVVWGMYVVPEYRGFGVGRRLLDAIINHGSSITYMMLKLLVTTHAVGALELYRAVGFSTYAKEPAFLCIDGITYDAYHMMYMYPRK